MELDQPGTAGSPFEAESSLDNLEFDSQSGVANVATMNLGLGLSESFSVEVSMSPLCCQAGNLGSGDTNVRLKWSLWGNDDGSSILALMPT